MYQAQRRYNSIPNRRLITEGKTRRLWHRCKNDITSRKALKKTRYGLDFKRCRIGSRGGSCDHVCIILVSVGGEVFRNQLFEYHLPKNDSAS
jgi:hypothetical protein